MGLDSVEILMCWEESLGVSIPSQGVSELITPAMAVEYLVDVVNAADARYFPCLGQRAFHHIRACLRKQNSILRRRISPDAYIRDLLKNGGDRASWRQFADDLGLGDLLRTFGLPLFGAGSTRVRDVITQTVASKAHLLVGPDERWSRQQIRAVVRTSVDFVVGNKNFADGDRFVDDIGIY